MTQDMTTSPKREAIVDNPNLWVIDRRDGSIRESTYVAEQQRAALRANEYWVGDEFYLPPTHSNKHVLTQYPKAVRDAYLDAIRQLVQVSRARRTPIEKIHERHKRMSMDMKDYLHLLWETKDESAEAPWYGEHRVEKFQGRNTTNTPEESDRFKSEIQDFYSFLSNIGVDMCDMSAEGCQRNLNALESYIEQQRLPKYQKTIQERDQELRANRAWIKSLGALPEHIPYFDGDFYDMDIDSLTTKPQYKLSAHANHIPLTIEACQQLDIRPSISLTKQIVDGQDTSLIPTSWRIGEPLETDFTQNGYGSLYQPIRDHYTRYKKDSRRNISKMQHALAQHNTMDLSISNYQEELINMGKHQHSPTKRSTDDPQFQKELDRMLGTETGDVPTKSKKGKDNGKKKHAKTDVFGSRIDFSETHKKKKDGDKPKKKKKKDKDGRDKPLDIGDAMDTSDAAKAISKSINSSKLKKVLQKSISEGRKSGKKK